MLADGEFERIQSEYALLTDKMQHECESEECRAEAVSLIENGEWIEREHFNFYDSKPVYFQHTNTEAILKLSYDPLLAVFRFEHIYDIKIYTEPINNWVDYFHCYRAKAAAGYIDFSIGDYQIRCDRVILESLTEQKKS